MRPLPKIPRCCHPQVWGPSLSPPVAGRPLRPATDRRHGGPSPRRPANRTRPPPPAPTPKDGLSSLAPPASERTRSWRRFPAGIPRRGAGRSRAPHPSATTRHRNAGPSDLHALGTPPALILSQDQTLHQNAARRSAPRGCLNRRVTATPHPNSHALPCQGARYHRYRVTNAALADGSG